MQRGIANSPTASSPTTPRAEDPPQTSKRRKVDTPQSPAANLGRSPGGATVDKQAVEAALAAEERKRQVAIAKQAAELGDSHWVLDFPTASPASVAKKVKAPLRVVQVGFAQIDTANKFNEGEDGVSEEEQGNPPPAGAQIRRFNMKKPTQDVKMESESESEESDDYRSSNPSTTYPDGSSDRRGRQSAKDSKRKRDRSETSAKRNAEKMRAHEFSAKRRKKELKLNMPTSISSANSFAPSPSSRRTSSGKGRR